jgi:hypothetical protein
LGFPNLTVQATAPLIPNYVVYHNTFFLFGNGINSGTGASWYAYSFASPTTISTSATNTFSSTIPIYEGYYITDSYIMDYSSNTILFEISNENVEYLC